MNQPVGAQGAAQGTSFGPYVLVRQLGAGAFGVVYEARKAPLNKRIALKVLHREKALDPNTIARFLQEARAAAGLNHPHIVAVDDLGVVDEVPYIAMEFLDGEPLSSLLRRERPLDPARALDIMLPVLSAVATVHESGIVHRDLKPDNIFLMRALAGRVHPKVLDFGIAKVNEGDDVAPTRSGFIMGTPEYMAIEQWGGSKHATPLSDQWALGAIVFECLCGRRPFEGEGVMALAMRISSGPPSPLRGFAPSLPAGLDAVVMRTMERLPERRFTSVRAFAAALLPYASPAARDLWTPEFERAAVFPPVPQTVALSAPPVAPPVFQTPDTFAQSSGMRDAPAPAAPSRRTAWIAGALGVLLLGGSVAVVRPLLSASDAPIEAHQPEATTNAAGLTPPAPTPAPTPAVAPVAPPVEQTVAQPEPAVAQPQPPVAQPEPAVAQPEPEPLPVQHVETDRERRARERREREVLAAANAARPSPVAAEPQPSANDGLTPMQRAQGCRTSTNNEPARNNCIINALRGRASTMQELGMLGATQMTAGRTADAKRTMTTYIQRYPEGPMVPTFERYINTH